MKIRKSATITITFTDEEDIRKCRQVHEIEGMTYAKIYMIGVNVILKGENKNEQ